MSANASDPRPGAPPTPYRRRRARPAVAVVVAAVVVLVAPLAPGATPAPAAAATCPSSLQALIDATPSGGTLTVPGCVFHESISIRRPITLQAAGATVDGDGTRATGVVVSANDVVIDGLAVTRVRSDSHVGAVNLQGGDRFTFRNGTVRDSATVCIALHGATGARVTDNEITGCGKEGYFLNGMANSLFARNRIHHNNAALAYDWFVEAGGGKTMASSGITFDDNEVAWNRGPGIWFDNGARDVVVTSNRVHDNDREGIFFEISAGARIEGNAVWNNGWSFSPWGWGAGISVSSSDRAQVARNTVAWNARGISVISQARQLSPHDHNTVTDNVVVSATGDRIAGWYDDHGGSLFASANANSGSRNRYWAGISEPTSDRFEWNGGRNTLVAYNSTPGEDGGTYLDTGDRDAILGAAGIPLEDGTMPPPPGPLPGDPRFSVGGSALGASGVPVKISWRPIAVADAYQVQLQRDDGSWTGLKLASPTSRSVTVTLAPGHSYRARLRLRTPPATWSAWAVSAAIRVRRYEETSAGLAWATSTWKRVASRGASAGYVRRSGSSGARATFSFTGRAVAWVAPVGPTRGSARVYVDGAYRTKVSLYRTSSSVRRVVWRTAWTTTGAHTIEIRVVGTSGHPRVDIDAFAVVR